MFGFLNINKAAGLTSHDVVARVRRLVGRRTRTGHAGTLDPAATGVLPVALGQATRLIEYLAEARKGYRATVALGRTTTTDDAEGEVLHERPVPPLDAPVLEAALQPFRGNSMQVPPMYSALHHQGQRLYDLARAGKTVERAPRPVTFYRLDLLDWSPTSGQVVLDVACSKGTYIRALARDLGEALGCGAHLAALQRTFVGGFRLEESATLATLQAANEQGTLAAYLLPPDYAIADWPVVQVSPTEQQRIRNGQPLHLPDTPPAGGYLRAHTAEGRLLALLQHDASSTPPLWKPHKVFPA